MGVQIPDPQEVELKLTVRDPAAVRTLLMDPGTVVAGATPLGPVRSLAIEDRYVDTADGALRRAGLVARIRTADGGRRITLKSAVRAGAGAVHRRLELDGPAGDPGIDDPRSWTPSPARDRLVSEIGAGRLVTTATLRQHRLQRDVAFGRSVIELSLDEIDVGGTGGEGSTWTELECELRAGSEADLAALGAVLLRRPDVEPATSSKLERALRSISGPLTHR